MQKEKTQSGKIVKSFKDDILEHSIHPSTNSAYTFLKSLPVGDIQIITKILKDNADKGSEIGKINLFAFDRFIKDEPLSDLHILGLAWTINAIVTEIQIETTAKKLQEAMKESLRNVDKNKTEKPE